MPEILRKLTLQEAIASTRPVWIEDSTRTNFSGWAMFWTEHVPMLAFKVFGCSAPLAYDREKYGKTWVCWNDEPEEGEK